MGAISSRGIPLLRGSEASIGETSVSDDASAVCAEIQASLGNEPCVGMADQSCSPKGQESQGECEAEIPYD